MAEKTIMLTRGRVPIPAVVRERMGWSGGTVLELEQIGEGVLLREKVARGHRGQNPSD